MEYDPVTYWNKRKNPNSSDVAPAWIKEYVSQFVKGEGSVFELGAGVGRTFDVYAPGAQVTTLDLSRQYMQQLRARAEARGLKLTQHFLSNSDEDFPFHDNEFPLSLCIQVLMHVPPQYIVHSMKELSRVSESAVVVAGVNEEWAKTPTHCFNHDYLGICREIGVATKCVVRRKDSICFVMQKNPIATNP